MKKLLIVLALLAASLAHADSIIGTLPVTLTNGTLADANQVMSNFNAIVTAVNTGAAANGSNSSITALTGLTTPITPAQGGSSVYTGTDAGSANAYSIAGTIPTNFSLRSGNTVNFTPSFTNTGAATLTVAGTTATAILRQTAVGLQPLAGGEIFTSQIATVVYDGTQYELINSAVSSNVQPCTSIDYVGTTVPTGYLVADGSAKSRTTFATLFGCMAATGVSATLNGTTTVTVANGNLYQPGWYVGGANITCNSVIQSVGSTTIVLNNAAGASGSSTLTVGPQPQGDCSTTFNLPNFQGRTTAGADPSGAVLPAVTATATGTASGTSLTLTSVTGTVLPGMTVNGPIAAIPLGITIVSQSSGTTGGAGVYMTSGSTTASSTTVSFAICNNPASIGSTCGAQTTSLLTANFPSYTPTGTITIANGTNLFGGNVGAGTTANTGSNTIPLGNQLITAQYVGAAQGGTNAAFSRLQPTALVTKAIKF